MNISQIVSILAAILTAGIAIYALVTGTLAPAEAAALIATAAGILGVHTGGSVAGSLRE